MIIFPAIPGVEINLFFIIFLSLAVGVISGFTGVGGGFIMAPALIILGFPAQFAVGTSLIWVMGAAIIGTFRHRQLGNVDMKLGILMTVFVMAGVEVGVRALNWTRDMGSADTTVLSIFICILPIVGGYTAWESSRTKTRLDKMTRNNENSLSSRELASISSVVQRIKIPPVIHFSKSGVNLSMWVILVIGLITGTLAGFLGCGGGFIMVPSLIYLFGVPSYVAVGTSTFQFIFSAAFGSIMHTINGNIIIDAALIMILGSSIGVQFGALATRYLRGIAMRYILAYNIFVAVLASVLKLISILSGSTISWLQCGMIAITFGGLGLGTLIIISLSIVAHRYRGDKNIPAWIELLVIH